MEVEEYHSMYAGKHDKGKARMDLIDPYFEQELAMVMTHGADTYGDESWKTVPRPEVRYLAALKRHTNAIARGEIIDPSSGKSHAAHIAANAMFLHYFQTQQRDPDPDQEKFDFDHPPKKISF